MGISYHKNIPLYYQIESYLRSKIEAGELAPNAKLPPEKEFCRRNGVSQGTLRRALERLEQDSLIVRKVGRGTFVANIKKDSEFPIAMRLVGFLEDLVLYGKKAEVKVLNISTVAANEEMARFFRVNKGEDIPHFARLKFISGLPLYYVLNYVKPGLGEKISENDLLQWPPLELFEKKFKRVIEYVEQQIEAKRADPDVAEKLGLNIFEPILHIRLAVYEKKGEGLELVDMFCRADRYRFIAELRKRRGPWSYIGSGGS